MHELSIARSLVQEASNHVPFGKHLTKVHVTIGPLSGIWADALEFCFSAVTKELGYDTVQLALTRVPADFQCVACGGRYASETVYSNCPDCLSTERTTLAGARFSLDAIDVEDNDDV
jgi:hydrogenase nickel incorporation protein HypA/HybF